MKKEKINLKNILFNNFPLKLLAFVLAVFTFFITSI